MAIGTTIDGLNSVTSLTTNDEVPVWDKEASGEPTKKITAQNMAASVKTLGSLVNTTEMNNALAGKQNTLTFDTTPTTGSTNPVTSGGIATAIQQSTAKTVVSGTTSFRALDNDSYESRALDNLHNSIASKTSGVVELESNGGPLYYTVLLKYADNYYSGYLSTYSSSASWIVYRYAYQNGLFMIYKAA